MATLKKETCLGQVQYIGSQVNRKDTLETTEVDLASFDLGGMVGDSHNGIERASCVRMMPLYPVGTPLKNARQLSAVSTEELQAIANEMKIAAIDPVWLGANICISSIPSLSLLPPSTRLVFESGMTMVIDLENTPCPQPEWVMSQYTDSFQVPFVKAAKHKRGVCGWVERAGDVKLGDSVEVWTPKQPVWPKT
ncbi:MOSC domain-containing protein [Flexibacterium corallicola]|uniref:MOSC domain-containing protein n=1 Tax=Flexibacterium corallicola TaxID=3037259 RepID=UPI00286FA607|nr:MOSC domain-containing protein [Pseudovibrio sp. M1P-2-3]